MTYQEAIDYLYSRLPMYSRIGSAAYKADLTNTIRICQAFDNPQNQFKTIHVAGTNGKGSVSHMLAAILQTAGYKTGLYTSPHLKDFRERIKTGNSHGCREVSEEFVASFTERSQSIVDEIQPSFFELTVVMAFEYFSIQKVDVAVIETGLGGRLDSTNVILPELSIITNIGKDHMNILGDTLEKIAFEKAGIIKENVPVVIGETLSETLPVFKQVAREKNAPLFISSQKRQVMDWAWNKNELTVEVAEDHHTDHRRFHMDLPGVYQTRNLLTVLEAVAVLNDAGWNLDENAIQKGIQHTKKLTGLHGRWEIIHNSPTVVLDVAHNEDGMKQLIQQVEVMLYRQLHIVIGMVKDKDIEPVLSLLPKNANYYFTKAQIPRALPETELLLKAKVQRLKGKAFPEVNEALGFALNNAHKDDLVIVCGSVFLVGEVRTMISN